jgi:hypothetical protein
MKMLFKQYLIRSRTTNEIFVQQLMLFIRKTCQHTITENEIIINKPNEILNIDGLMSSRIRTARSSRISFQNDSFRIHEWQIYSICDTCRKQMTNRCHQFRVFFKSTNDNHKYIYIYICMQTQARLFAVRCGQLCRLPETASVTFYFRLFLVENTGRVA